MTSRAWITPFKKQCFVVTGASVNMSQIGMVMGFAAVLMPQLRAKDSIIPIDEVSGSWIAALPGFALVLGNITIPTIMAKFGRKKANMLSICIVLAGWSCIAFANSLACLLVARLLQGLSAGMSSCLVPTAIGEYTSPKTRGAFTMAMSFIMAVGTLTVHTLGSYSSWKTAALICSIITFVDLLIVAYSPDTPSWLASKGRFEECRTVFQWLRGYDENDELEKMIEASKLHREVTADAQASPTLVRKIRNNIALVKLKEFYKPIFIMMHIYSLGQWAGINVLAPHTVDLITYVVGRDVNTALILVTIDVQRIISCVFAVYFIRIFRRKTMLLATGGLNLIILLATAGYTFAKAKNMLLFDHPIIGVVLIHLHMVTVAVGTLPLPYVIAGEIFPLRFRSLSSGISSVVCSAGIFFCVKTFNSLVKDFGIHGAYSIYAGILVYCLTVAWFFLPETKDRTLQDIEEEFKGKSRTADDLKEAQTLKSVKLSE